MTDPIPVLLITGYLGAGKTTLLNGLLRAPRVAGMKPCLIINEFGPMGVDGHLLPGGPETKFEINQGSLFCTCTKSQFVLTLAHIARELKPGLVLIEATGVSETRNLEGASAVPALSNAFRLLANVCVVDAVNFTKAAAFHRTASAQVRWADGLVIGKADLIGQTAVDALQRVLADLNPDVPRTVASFGEVNMEFVFGLRHVERAGDPFSAAPSDFTAVSVCENAAVDRAVFAAVLRSLGERLLRLKGNVAFAGEGARFVEVVGGQRTEAEPRDGFEARTAFTAIIWRADADDVRGQFRACLRPV